MTPTQDELMAYVDGELAQEGRARIEAFVAENSEARAFVEKQAALRRALDNAFGPVAREPVPAAMMELLSTSAAKPQFHAVRTQPSILAGWMERLKQRAMWTWLAPAAGVAAGVAIAAMLGFFSRGDDLIMTNGAAVAAAPRLDRALTQQLAADENSALQSGVRIGVSFEASDGRLCRTFDGIDADRGGVAGVACRDGGQWQVTAIAKSDVAGDADLYRPAGSAMPPLVREAVGDMIKGDPFDANAEQAARARDWRSR